LSSHSKGSTEIEGVRVRKRVARRIFGLKREEVEGGLRRLRIENHHNWKDSPNVINEIKF